MRVSFVRSYKSRNGNATFVYIVNANAADLEKYKAAQGEFYREDESGKPIWFTTRFIGKVGNLIITTNGNVVPDMSAFDQAASIAAQYGGNLGAELAKTAAAQLLGFTDQPESAPASAPKIEHSEPLASDPELGDL